MKYLPYSKLDGVPNIVVDGAAQEDTILTLSHWPGSDSPPEFRADTSTEIVLNYLSAKGSRKKYAPKVNRVSNNHFDEDGLCSVWAMVRPKEALSRSDLLTDVARAGDFSNYRRPQAAKVVFTIRNYCNPATSPVVDELEGDDGSGSKRYEALLPLLEDFMDDTDRYGPYWDDEWADMLKSKTAMVMGQVELREVTHVDLAVARTPEALHPMVLYNSTERLRVLTALPGGYFQLCYRYETWVQFASRPVMPRVDLTPLLPRLQELEHEEVCWTYEGNAVTMPVMQPLGPDGQPAASSLSTEALLDELVAFYEQEQDNTALQWNPDTGGEHD
ncbi:DUF6687 family protein [Chloroflexota bacterium]